MRGHRTAGAATIRKLLRDPKWLGSDNVGFFGVLHTWGRDPMIFHPHVHFIVPCGGVSEDGTKTARRRLVWLYLGWTFWLGSGVAPQPDRFVSKRPPCEHCGGQLHLIAITDGSSRGLVSRDVPRPALASHATNYLDSG